MSGDGSGRMRRIDVGTTALFGAVYAAALFLIVTGFTVEPSGCGGRFQDSCTGDTYWRLGIGFGLILVAAPLLHKFLPGVPAGQGTGRTATIIALLVGAGLGAGLAHLGFTLL